MARYRYEPRDAGWISIHDMWHTLVAAIDCSSGGAQAALDELCRDFARVGWEFGQRSFDNVYMRRGGVRWEISIGGSPYGRPTSHGPFPGAEARAKYC